MTLVALQLGGIFETVSELSFILKIVVFVYLLYWLFITFRGGVLFGVALLGATYLVFFYSISTTILLLVFVVFVIFGNHFQMLLDFGLRPIYHAFGKAPPWEPQQAEQMRIEQLQQKYASGQLSREEEKELANMYQMNPHAASAAGHQVPQGPDQRIERARQS